MSQNLPLFLKLLSPFHSARFLKNSKSRSKVMKMCHFRVQNGPFVLNKIFLIKNIIITHVPIGSFHCAKFKEILTTYPEL